MPATPAPRSAAMRAKRPAPHPQSSTRVPDLICPIEHMLVDRDSPASGPFPRLRPVASAPTEERSPTGGTTARLSVLLHVSLPCRFPTGILMLMIHRLGEQWNSSGVTTAPASVRKADCRESFSVLKNSLSARFYPKLGTKRTDFGALRALFVVAMSSVLPFQQAAFFHAVNTL